MSSLLQVAPPLCRTSVRCTLRGRLTCVLPSHATTGFHVPCIGQVRVHAAYMPDAGWPVQCSRSTSSRSRLMKSGFEIVFFVRRFLGGSLALVCQNDTRQMNRGICLFLDRFCCFEHPLTYTRTFVTHYKMEQRHSELQCQGIGIPCWNPFGSACSASRGRAPGVREPSL